MTAAHYIALLLLSTVGNATREHREIIEQNGPGVWLALAELDLVDRDNEQALWSLTDRGRVLVEHVLALPLPEQVTGWRMPSSGVSIGTLARILVAKEQPPQPLPSDPVDDDGEPPPKPAAPKPIPGVVPADSPAERHAQARELLDRGFGVNEVADTLELELSVVEGIFFGNG